MDKVPCTITLRGTFLGWDKDTWQTEQGDKAARPVLVFATDSIRYTQAVRVGAARVEEIKELLEGAEGREVALDVFPGDYKALILKSVLEVL
jgi:hypothetical protein